jgi:hypothetical protein
MSNLTSGIDELAGVAGDELAACPAVLLQDELAELHTAIGRLQAQFARRLAVLDQVGACGDERAVPTAAWLRHVLRLSEDQARRQLSVARRCYGPAAAHATALAAARAATAEADGASAADGADSDNADGAGAVPDLPPWLGAGCPASARRGRTD